MRTVEISQAADWLPEYCVRKRRQVWVLTRRGRPVAALVPIDDEDYFSMRLANDPRFIEIIERSRVSYETKGGVSLGEMRRKYGLPAKSGRGCVTQVAVRVERGPRIGRHGPCCREFVRQDLPR